MSRRRRQYTRASDVTVIDASTGEKLGVEESYDPWDFRDIVAAGHKKSDPARRRATNRRQPQT